MFRLIVAVTLLCCSLAQGEVRTYHVGNSLTFDSRIYVGQGAIVSANDAGIDWTTGWHIDCGDSLTNIVNNPTDNCVDPPPEGIWNQALPNNAWDAITLQPFDSRGATLQNELDSAKALIQAADTNVVYIYESWPSQVPGETISSLWNAPITTNSTDTFQRNKGHLDWVFQGLKSDPDLAGISLRVIPTVDVLIALEAEILAGSIPDLSTTEDLYRDVIHVNNLGRYVAANTVIATLFNQSTENFPFVGDFLSSSGSGPVPITSDTQELVHASVWEAVTGRSETRVVEGDLNRDGIVGIADLNTVLGNWNQVVSISHVADLDNDGFVGIADLNIVLGTWNNTAAAVAIPEPGSLLLLGGLFMLRRK